MKQTFVLTGGTTLTFDCDYCREIESKNWHYYKQKSGEMVHIRKKHLMMVVGGTYDDIINNRQKEGNPIDESHHLNKKLKIDFIKVMHEVSTNQPDNYGVYYREKPRVWWNRTYDRITEIHEDFAEELEKLFQETYKENTTD